MCKIGFNPHLFASLVPHGVRRIVPFLVLVYGLPLAYGWVDGTPYLVGQFSPLPGVPDSSAAPAQPAPPALGDRHSFFSVDVRTQEQYIVPATLRAIGEFCYLYVEDSQWGQTVKRETLETVRRAFDESTPADPQRGIYRIQTELFGAPPDVDGDAKIYLLLLDIRDGAVRGDEFIAGFFNPADQRRGVLRHPELGIPVRSNERDLLYIDTHPLDTDGAEGLGVIAHEFLHLIQWRHDRDETIWVNEGCADVAMFLCGYRPEKHTANFERHPLVSLTNWPLGSRSELAHYGASYLWMLYLYEHYGGPETIAAVVRERANGITGVNNALLSQGLTRTFSTIFADWKVANLLDDTQFAEGQYGYQNEELTLRVRRRHNLYPVTAKGGVLESYAADYITLLSSGGWHGLNVVFEIHSPLARRGVFDDSRLYDLKAIEFQDGRPSLVLDVPLTANGKGSMINPNFGLSVGQITLVPSVQPHDAAFADEPSTYEYHAELGTEITFNASVLPNPVHSRYWDIIAVPSSLLGVNAPLVTVSAGKTVIVSGEPMTPVQDGAIYTYPIYLSAEIEPTDVEWQVQFSDRIVGEGKLRPTEANNN
ncbi:MAG: hypothetical protein OXN17_17175 [Candidatus Poribacteria bacterium]|nr:hypothetical protein [Candidatus Poribacteria bacterium]MDE0505812.1 hypothetical protein [Candidatus Poribacteria bacterium]